MNTQTATEYRDLPLNVLTESTTNPRRVFEDAALKELAESIRVQESFHPCLFVPLPSRASRSSPERGVIAPHRCLIRRGACPQGTDSSLYSGLPSET